MTIPVHAGETIGPRLLGYILEQAGLSPEIAVYNGIDTARGCDKRIYVMKDLTTKWLEIAMEDLDAAESMLRAGRYLLR